MISQVQTYQLRQSFARLRGKEEIVSLVFYRRLFQLAPAVRPLFRGDIEEQGRKLMRTLEFALSRLDEPSVLTAELEALGARHVGYGVGPEHYPVVNRALIDALAESLGDEFTPEVRQAWSGLLELCAAVMIRGVVKTGRPTVNSVPTPG